MKTFNLMCLMAYDLIDYFKKQKSMNIILLLKLIFVEVNRCYHIIIQIQKFYRLEGSLLKSLVILVCSLGCDLLLRIFLSVNRKKLQRISITLASLYRNTNVGDVVNTKVLTTLLANDLSNIIIFIISFNVKKERYIFENYFQYIF